METSIDEKKFWQTLEAELDTDADESRSDENPTPGQNIHILGPLVAKQIESGMLDRGATTIDMLNRSLQR